MRNETGKGVARK